MPCEGCDNPDMARGPFENARFGIIPSGLFGPVQDGRPILNGVAGTALVVRGDAGFSNLANWTGSCQLQVTVPGHEPYLTEHACWIIREKHPVRGCTLPVTVNPDDPADLRIEWDEAPTIDERISRGEPAFLDPEGVWRRVAPLARPMSGADPHALAATRELMAAYLPGDSVLLQDMDRLIHPGATADVDVSPWQRAALTGWPPGDGSGRRLPATALVVSASKDPQPYMSGDSFMPASRFASRGGSIESSAWHYLAWLLLCVVLPSGSRHAVYLKTRVHTRHMDAVLPVTVHPDDASDVHIEWSAAPDNHIADAARINETTERMKARAAESFALQKSMWDAAGSALTPAVAAQPRDVAGDLARLQKLHDSGVLSDAEYAAQRTKILDSI